MKVLLSWSGNDSHICAQAMREWLPLVFQSVEPWMSSADITPGSRWASELDAQLDTTNFGIIFLTKTNLTAPWILFEAGALSKSLSTGCVIPYLIDLKPSEIPGPLSQFQALTADRNGTHKLVEAISNAVQANKRTTEEIHRVFEMWWPSLQSKLTPSTAKSNIIENSQEASATDDEGSVECAYDWYNEIGYKDSSELLPGTKVLYEEHAIFPDMDEEYYKRLRRIRIPEKPFAVSPRGFIKVSEKDWEWIDPRKKDRRIYESEIGDPIQFGISCVVDVLREQD